MSECGPGCNHPSHGLGGASKLMTEAAEKMFKGDDPRALEEAHAYLWYHFTREGRIAKRANRLVIRQIIEGEAKKLLAEADQKAKGEVKDEAEQ